MKLIPPNAGISQQAVRTPAVRDIHVPAPLRDLPLWLVWAYEQHAGDAKPRKVPQYSGGGRRVGDLGRLTTFAAAKDAAAKRGLDGVGFAPTAGAGVVALDFDNCVVDGKVDQTVLDLVQGIYAEYSPSGNGVRAFFMGDPGLLGNRKSHGLPFGIEAFSTTGFVTVTGRMLDHIDLLGLEDVVAPLPPRVIDYFQTRFGTANAIPASDDFMAGYEPRLGLTLEQMMKVVNALDPDIGREDWIKVGMALHHECEGDDTGFEIWNDWSSAGGKYPTEEALRDQWESFTRRMGPGRKQVTMASAIRLAKEAGLHWPLQPSASDITARVEAIVNASEGYTGKYSFRCPAELASAPATRWLIKRVLPAADLIVLFGASGAGKSFVALDMAAHIAQGIPWRGMRTREGRVAYIAAEGGGGMGNRLKAYAVHNQIELASLDLRILTAAPNFLDADDITEVVAALCAVGDVAMIIVDTFAQVTPGANENGAEDMGRALRNARMLREVSGATVMLVHHAGKDASRGARGWSGIKAAADAEIEVVRHEHGREIRVTKMKDGDDAATWGFTLAAVDLGTDDDGDPLTSCVVQECEARKAPTRHKSPVGGSNQRLVFDSAHALGVAKVEGVLIRDVIEEALKRSPLQNSADHQRDQRPARIRRALDTLVERGAFFREGARLYSSDRIREPTTTLQLQAASMQPDGANEAG
jgi:hypothetical protein